MTRPATPGNGRPAPIDCEHAVRRLWDYLDARLPVMSHDEVEVHLETCAGCARHFAFARTMQTAIAASAWPPVQPDEEARLRARIRAALGTLAAEEGDAEGRRGS